MKNADMPAMPQSATNEGYGCNYTGSFNGEVPTGLTKREMFAMNAMQGLLSSESAESWYEQHEDCAKAAVNYADALLKELEK